MVTEENDSISNFEPALNISYQMVNFSADDFTRLELSVYLRIAVSTFCLLSLTLGTLGNILVVVVIWKAKELRSSMSLFLVNLSLADLMILLMCVPLVLVELHTNLSSWLLGEGMCKVVPYVQMTTEHASVLTILAISFERYYAICQPLKAGYKCTPMRALVIIAVIWLVAALSTTPMLFTIRCFIKRDLYSEKFVNVCFMSVELLWQKLFYLLSIGIFYILPFLILLVVYCHIGKHLMTCSKGLNSSNEENQMRSRRQVVLMLVAVVVSFFVCMLPFRIFVIWLILSPPEDIINLGTETYFNLLYSCSVLLYINATLNPFLYNAISSKFRRSFIHILGCSSIRKTTKSTTASNTATIDTRTNNRKLILSFNTRQHTAAKYNKQQLPLDHGKNLHV
ncbi:unnamed protein product [Larinioides sclopetarius]|uniref:G-protein coupled receptors family 1 profile domain-containing protein n=1 Tax=Larinioides sclopetarius TaxID=280406 RepID=A0AAV2AC31_9ARAC